MTGATGTGEVEESIRVQRTRRLWLRVIQQTVQEAQGKSLYGVPHSDYPRHVRLARRWLADGRLGNHRGRLPGMDHAAGLRGRGPDPGGPFHRN